MDNETIGRWRLVLGKDAETNNITIQSDSEYNRIENLLDYLFTDGYPESDRSGGLGPSSLTVPDWIEGVSELFPASAKEIMEKEFISRKGIYKLLQQPELLEKIEPNPELVKTIISHKGLLNENTRSLARKIIDTVVEELKQKIKFKVERSITGAIRRDRHSPQKVYKNIDLKKTIYQNLKNWDPEKQRLLVDNVFYYAAERKKRPWHIIILVDQSGSMLDSAIFSAIMASIFAELPSLRTSLVLFDTEIVDLTDQVGQPVDVLLSIQLGGGTDITKAMIYGNQLVREPQRTIVVLISDFCEGSDEKNLLKQTEFMYDAGIRLIGLGALGYNAVPEYCRTTAKKLKKRGMDILSCTPERLAESMAQIIQ